MSCESMPRLGSFPFFFRMGICALVITLLGGYIVSGLHLRWHYDNRDEVPGLTINDIVGAYHGVQTPSPLIEALESGHPDTIEDYERTELLGWLEGDRVSLDYDNLDLGELAPSEIIAVSCVDCHTRPQTRRLKGYPAFTDWHRRDEPACSRADDGFGHACFGVAERDDPVFDSLDWRYCLCNGLWAID